MKQKHVDVLMILKNLFKSNDSIKYSINLFHCKVLNLRCQIFTETFSLSSWRVYSFIFLFAAVCLSSILFLWQVSLCLYVFFNRLISFVIFLFGVVFILVRFLRLTLFRFVSYKLLLNLLPDSRRNKLVLYLLFIHKLLDFLKRFATQGSVYLETSTTNNFFLLIDYCLIIFLRNFLSNEIANAC